MIFFEKSAVLVGNIKCGLLRWKAIERDLGLRNGP